MLIIWHWNNRMKAVSKCKSDFFPSRASGSDNSKRRRLDNRDVTTTGVNIKKKHVWLKAAHWTKE